jgi:membrane protein
VALLQEHQAHTEPAVEPVQSSGNKISRTSRKFSLAVSLLLLLSMCVFWLISAYNTQNLLRQQADSLGQTVAQQTAVQLTELVLANDLISMNVVLGGITRDSSIAEVAVLNINNEVIVAAGGAQSAVKTIIPLPVTLNPLEGVYVAPILLADSVAGYVRLTLDLSYIEVGIVNNFIYIIAASLLLMTVAATLTTTYFQYLISFPINYLALTLSNIRKGKIETCPEPDSNSEISTAIKQFNATAEFLAQNTFLDNFGHRKPAADAQNFKSIPGKQDVTLLNIRMANFQFLASTLSEERLVGLLNKYYFFAGKVCQLYNGHVCYCSDGEIVINFNSVQLEEEQAFYAICTGQLFLYLHGDLADIDGEHIAANFKLAVHSGQAVSGLYSPITQDTNNFTGKTLDLTRQICAECPDNTLLISETCFEHAGAGIRVSAEEYSIVDDEEQIITYVSSEPMSDYKLLLERQAIQLATLYSE